MATSTGLLTRFTGATAAATAALEFLGLSLDEVGDTYDTASLFNSGLAFT